MKSALIWPLIACRGTDKVTSDEIESNTDVDNDGSHLSNGDCDDENAAINPSATEICDSIDNDCDGFIDGEVKIDFYVDAAGDGFGDSSQLQQACLFLFGVM